jgi:hypothetical protein
MDAFCTTPVRGYSWAIEIETLLTLISSWLIDYSGVKNGN